MRKFLSILFWSIISAAFIGPGTITAAASAGARFGYSLLWALLFSTLATLILQEASARLAIGSGLNLGQAIRQRFSEGLSSIAVLLLVLGAVVFGCAAYETGNILGATAGAVMSTGWPQKLLTLGIGFFAFLVLWSGSAKFVSYFLGGLVALMGVAFLATAFLLELNFADLLQGSFIPTFPPSSGLLILGLVGTTVVPYNLFLGSALASGRNLNETRFGLTVAVILGGIISMAVLVVGTAVSGSFSYQGLTEALQMRLGNWAGIFFAIGLCIAGVSSAITAPFAATITARSLISNKSTSAWCEKSWQFRTVWVSVLLIGVLFGLTDIQPIPAIILAQALNGIVLPFVAIFLLISINDVRFMPPEFANGLTTNIFTGLVVVVTIFLGLRNLIAAFERGMALF